MKYKNVVLRIDGGAGKCIAGTAVCRAIKKQYPKQRLIVISGYPDIFKHSKTVDRSVHPKEDNIFANYIEEGLFLFSEPYF